MSDDEDYMDDSEAYDDDDDDDEVFEAPTIQHQESAFAVLTPEDCEAKAKAEVQAVVELLCCEPGVAHILLRHFKWDRDKLTDGTPWHTHACASAVYLSAAHLPDPSCRGGVLSHVYHS